MRAYADVRSVRVRQMVMDSVTALWIALWVRVGLRIVELVDLLQGPGRSLEGAGTALADRAGGLGERAEELPIVGSALRAPFRAIRDGGLLIHEAGVSQQSAVHTLALWLGLVIAVVPITWALVRYLPGRIRWMREASAARQASASSSGLALFALRALVNQPVSALIAVCPDPVAAYQHGDYEALAALELRGLGLTGARPSRHFVG